MKTYFTDTLIEELVPAGVPVPRDCAAEVIKADDLRAYLHTRRVSVQYKTGLGGIKRSAKLEIIDELIEEVTRSKTDN